MMPNFTDFIIHHLLLLSNNISFHMFHPMHYLHPNSSYFHSHFHSLLSFQMLLPYLPGSHIIKYFHHITHHLVPSNSTLASYHFMSLVSLLILLAYLVIDYLPPPADLVQLNHFHYYLYPVLLMYPI